jgi:hypothetical protein
VPTKESADLHLWLPETEEVSMDAQVGNLSVFYDLDLRDLKDALGIPRTEFMMARTTLRQIAEQYDVPEQEIKDFFAGFYTYNGWKTLLTGELYGTSFWGALLRTLIVTIVSLALLIFLSILTGYGLAGLRRKYQMVVFNTYLLQMVIPAMLILLPQFMMIQWFYKLIPAYADEGVVWRQQLAVHPLCPHPTPQGAHRQPDRDHVALDLQSVSGALRLSGSQEQHLAALHPKRCGPVLDQFSGHLRGHRCLCGANRPRLPVVPALLCRGCDGGSREGIALCQDAVWFFNRPLIVVSSGV